MTPRHDLDQQLTAFLRDGPEQLPYESFDAVRDRTELTRQRVVIGPWRTPIMNRFITYGLGAVAVVAILIIGAQLMRTPETNPGAGSTPTARPSATERTQPSASPTTAPPLSQSFTSSLNGISMSYPAGWKAQAATKPWTNKTFPVVFLANKQADFLYDPTLRDHLFLNFASQPIGNATPEAWVARQMASDEGCADTEPITVDGAAGLIGTGGCTIAVVTTDGRGYWIQVLTSGDEAWLGTAFDRAWFEDLLATVQLHPKDAVK